MNPHEFRKYISQAGFHGFENGTFMVDKGDMIALFSVSA